MSTIYEVPTFLEAPTKEELRDLMIENNLKSKTHYIYSNFTWDGSSWVCWFYKDMKKELMDQLGGN